MVPAGSGRWRGPANAALDALGRLIESRQTHEEAFEIRPPWPGRPRARQFSRALRHYRAADFARTLGTTGAGAVLGDALSLSSEGLHGEAAETGEQALALARTRDDLTLLKCGPALGWAGHTRPGQYRLGIGGPAGSWRWTPRLCRMPGTACHAAPFGRLADGSRCARLGSGSTARRVSAAGAPSPRRARG